MRIADSRTALERGLPPIYVWRFAPHDVGRDDETKVARHEDQWRGSARDIFHVSPIHDACRRFEDRFPPLTFGDSLPITSAVLTMHMAMTDRDASHGTSSMPTTNLRPDRKKASVNPLRVCPMCVSFGCAFRCALRCAIRCAKSCGAQSRWLECVINDGAHRLAHATMKR